MKLLTYILFVWCFLYESVSASNILSIFNFPSKSHHLLGEVLSKGLVKRGHNVTMISPYALDKPMENYTDIQVRDVLKIKEGLQHLYQGNASIWDRLAMISAVNDATITFFENDSIKRLLKSNSKFDVVIQFQPYSDPFLGFADYFNAPVIGFAPIGGLSAINHLLGNPAPYSYVPNAMGSFSDDMTFLQRVTNTLFDLFCVAMEHIIFRRQHIPIIKKYFPDAPSLDELRERIDLVLVNSHVSTETPRPYLPNVIQIGGFHLQEPQTLPHDLKSFLDQATEGVVYLSLGTNVRCSELPKEKLDAFLKYFERLPQKILWKFEDDNLPQKPKNVKIAKWVPQRAVLVHPNVKIFVTHGGMGGSTEALYYGVPLVCIPFFGDQFKNCNDVASRGYAVEIAFKDLTETSFGKAMDEILNNNTYRNNVKFRSDLFREQPINPMDKAIYWVEHVIKHKGAKHLKAKAAYIPLYQYLLLDVVTALIVGTIVILAILFWIIRAILKCAFGSKEKVKLN